MKIVCIGMDDQGQFFVGQKPEGMGMNQPPEQAGEDMSMEGAEMSESPESYMQPVQSISEAFQAARSMLMDGGEQGQNDFDAGVKRILGPNPRPSMDNPRQMAPMPPRGPKGM